MDKYLNLLGDVMGKGTYKPPAREGMPGSMSLFGYQIRYDLQNEFPLLTTKKMYFKGIVHELIWFLQGGTNIKYLVDNNCNFWNDDAYNYYKIKCEQYGIAPYPKDDFISFIRNGGDLSHGNIPGYSFGDVGYQYGKVWRNWTSPEVDEIGEPTGNILKVDQIVRVINSLRNNPESRRHMVTAVDPLHDKELALYWCHSLFQFNARPLNEDQADSTGCKYALDCHLFQRSADTFLGVPFNMASYSLLTMLFAGLCGMIPGDFIHTFSDVHIYEDHYEAVHTQINREPMATPIVSVNVSHLKEALDRGENTSSVLSSIIPEMFELVFYESHPSIKANLSTGTGK